MTIQGRHPEAAIDKTFPADGPFTHHRLRPSRVPSGPRGGCRQQVPFDSRLGALEGRSHEAGKAGSETDRSRTARGGAGGRHRERPRAPQAPSALAPTCSAANGGATMGDTRQDDERGPNRKHPAGSAPETYIRVSPPRYSRSLHSWICELHYRRGDVASVRYPDERAAWLDYDVRREALRAADASPRAHLRRRSQARTILRRYQRGLIERLSAEELGILDAVHPGWNHRQAPGPNGKPAAGRTPRGRPPNSVVTSTRRGR